MKEFVLTFRWNFGTNFTFFFFAWQHPLRGLACPDLISDSFWCLFHLLLSGCLFHNPRCRYPTLSPFFFLTTIVCYTMQPDSAFVEPGLSLTYLILPGHYSHAGWVHDVPWVHSYKYRHTCMGKRRRLKCTSEVTFSQIEIYVHIYYAKIHTHILMQTLCLCPCQAWS